MIASLAVDPAVDALVVVTRAADLLDLGAWRGRLMLHPRDFALRAF